MDLAVLRFVSCSIPVTSWILLLLWPLAALEAILSLNHVDIPFPTPYYILIGFEIPPNTPALYTIALEISCVYIPTYLEITYRSTG